MRILVLGCGEMGAFAVRDLHQHGRLDEVVVAARDPDKARHSLADLDSRVSFARLDVADTPALRGLMAGFDAVVNCVGPNYKFELSIARAAIDSRVHLVDLNDELETTLAMLELDAEARQQDVTIILGLGASPGVNNVLVRAAANQLDDVEEIHTAWVMTASDPGGPALSYHLVRSLSGRALTWEEGRMLEVRSLVDGRERVSFPAPVGDRDVFHAGHPEPITLQRAFPGAQTIDDKATFAPPEVNDWIVGLGRMVRESAGPVQIDGASVDAMDFAAAYLRQKCLSIPGVPREGALRVEVKGQRGRKQRRVIFSSAGLLGHGTGIPAAIGAVMLAQGKIDKRGVLAPEECVEPNDFLYELFNRRDVGKLNGWIEE